jgi:hypothetical protein
MDPLILSGVDRPLTPIVLGTMTFGDSVDERAAGEMIDDFLTAGGTGIDTANGYAGGRSESLLGRVPAGPPRPGRAGHQGRIPIRTPTAPRPCRPTASTAVWPAACAG